jgi:hypothetical protein
MERLPTAPTPENGANGNKPNMKPTRSLKWDVNELVLLLLPLCQIHSVRRLCMANSTIKIAFFGEQPDKHDQSDLEVDIVFNPAEIDKTNSSSYTNNERRIDSGTK